jgi:hypothetical protein
LSLIDSEEVLRRIPGKLAKEDGDVEVFFVFEIDDEIDKIDEVGDAGDDGVC